MVYRRSYDEDSVDRYNHTFSVGFLLALSLVTWILPLSPYLQVQQQEERSTPVMPKKEPTLKMDCWCPPQFTESHVAYVNAACTSALDRAMRRLNSSNSAGIYRLISDVAPGDDTDFTFKPRGRMVDSDKDSDSDSDKETMTTESYESTDKDKNDTSDKRMKDDTRFVRVTVPLVLFLLAIGLKLPQLVCGIYRCSFGAVNVDKALEAAAVAGGSRDDRRISRRQIAEALAQRSGTAAAWSYLLFKFLACVAAIVCFLVVHGSLLPRASQLDRNNQMAGPTPTPSPSSQSLSDQTTQVDDSNDDFHNDLVGTALLCDLPIRNLQNVQRFSVQCVVSVDDNHNQNDASALTPAIEAVVPAPVSAPAVTVPVYEVYETILLCVDAVLIVLSIINICSFLAWVIKLVASRNLNFVVSGGNNIASALSLDAKFMFLMAHENSGPEVVLDFVESGAWGGAKKCGDDIE